MSFNFTQGALPDGLTYTRSGSATYYDENGLTKTVAADTPRFQDGGLLFEEPRTNYALNSDMSDWDNVRGVASLDAGETGIDGVNGVYEFTPNTEVNAHYINNSVINKSSAAQLDMIASFKIKYNTDVNNNFSALRIRFFPSGGLTTDSAQVDVLFVDGVPQVEPIATFDNGIFTLNRWGFEKKGDYYRMFMCFTTGTEAALRGQLWPLNGLGQSGVAGDGVTPAFWYGDLQIEETVFTSNVQGDLGFEPTSQIITTGAIASRGKEQLLASGAFPYTKQGAIIADIKPLRFNTDEAYQFVGYFDDTRDSKSAELKIRNDSNPQRVWATVRGSDNIGYNGRNLGGTLVSGVRSIIGTSWQAEDGDIRTIGKGAGEVLTGNTPLNLDHDDYNQLYLGSRNAGEDPFNGIFYSVSIFNRYFNGRQLAVASKLSSKYTYFLSGQSLAQGKDDAITRGILGTKAYNREFRAFRGVPVEIYNGATGGSAVLKSYENSTDNHWVNDDAPDNLVLSGVAWDNWKNGVDAGYIPIAIEWCQGEAEALDVGNSEANRLKYKNALLFLLNGMKQYSGNANMQVFIQILGRRDATYNQDRDNGTQLIRQTQFELAQEYDWIHIAGAAYDQTIPDGIHPDDEGNEVAATRNARYINNYDGFDVSGEIIMPQIQSVSRSGTTVTVTTDKDTTGFLGFRFDDDGVEITSTGSRIDARTVELTLNSTPSGTETLYYAYGDYMGGIVDSNLGDVVKSTTTQALPLCPTKWENSGAGWERVYGEQ